MGQQSLDQLAGAISSILRGDPVGSRSMVQITVLDHRHLALKVFDVVNKDSFTGPMRMLEPAKQGQELWFDICGEGTAKPTTVRQRQFYSAVPRQIYELELGRRQGTRKTPFEIVRVIKQSSLHALV